MKKYFFALITTLLLSPVFGYSQELSDGGFQWGIEGRWDGFFINNIKLADISLGWRIDRKEYLGLRIGAGTGSSYLDAVPAHEKFTAFPLMADYTHYFPIGKSRKHSIILGAEAGPVFRHYSKMVEDREFVSTNKWGRKTFLGGIKFGLDFALGKPHIYANLHVNYVGVGCGFGFTF